MRLTNTTKVPYVDSYSCSIYSVRIECRKAIRPPNNIKYINWHRRYFKFTVVPLWEANAYYTVEKSIPEN